MSNKEDIAALRHRVETLELEAKTLKTDVKRKFKSVESNANWMGMGNLIVIFVACFLLYGIIISIIREAHPFLTMFGM